MPPPQKEKKEARKVMGIGEDKLMVQARRNSTAKASTDRDASKSDDSDGNKRKRPQHASIPASSSDGKHIQPGSDEQEHAVQLKKKREASRVSSRRTRQREKIKMDHFRSLDMQLEAQNKKLQAENQQIKDAIKTIKEMKKPPTTTAPPTPLLQTRQSGQTGAGAGEKCPTEAGSDFLVRSILAGNSKSLSLPGDGSIPSASSAGGTHPPTLLLGSELPQLLGPSSLQQQHIADRRNDDRSMLQLAQSILNIPVAKTSTPRIPPAGSTSTGQLSHAEQQPLQAAVTSLLAGASPSSTTTSLQQQQQTASLQQALLGLLGGHNSSGDNLSQQHGTVQTAPATTLAERELLADSSGTNNSTNNPSTNLSAIESPMLLLEILRSIGNGSISSNTNPAALSAATTSILLDTLLRREPLSPAHQPPPPQPPCGGVASAAQLEIQRLNDMILRGIKHPSKTVSTTNTTSSSAAAGVGYPRRNFQNSGDTASSPLQNFMSLYAVGTTANSSTTAPSQTSLNQRQQYSGDSSLLFSPSASSYGAVAAPTGAPPGAGWMAAAATTWQSSPETNNISLETAPRFGQHAGGSQQQQLAPSVEDLLKALLGHGQQQNKR